MGQLLAFDTHMNLVLADCEEWRTLKTKTSTGTSKIFSSCWLEEHGPINVFLSISSSVTAAEERQEKRFLGLTLLRGENVVSIQIQAPPPSEGKTKAQAAAGPGVARSAGRGLGAPRGLSGPVSGVGGPSSNAMQPTGIASSAPQQPSGMPPGGAPPGMPPGMPPRPPGMPPQPGLGYGGPQNQQQFPPRSQ